MNFFQAQKKLVWLWFLWALLLSLYLAMGIILNHYKDVLGELMVWLLKYPSYIFTLIFGSVFFQKRHFEEELRDKIYFWLAMLFSIFYILFISEILIVEPRRHGLAMDNEMFLSKLEQSGQLLNFISPLLFAFLSYFFYRQKKTSSQDME